MQPADGDTVPVQRGTENELVQTSLELRIRFNQGGRRVVPINRSSLELEIEHGPNLHFRYQAGRLSFRKLGPSGVVYQNGEATNSGRMEVGSTLEVGDQRILLWDTGRPQAYLKGYSAPYSNEIWPLGPGEHPVGRPGQRTNSVNLDHPTVSRSHATLVGSEDGSYLLKAESATNPVWLGGAEIAPGETRPLQHGDLLEFGELVLRFHNPQEDPPSDEPGVSVRSLGGLWVEVGGAIVNEKAWKTQFVKWLFARLAYQWGRPHGVEMLIEELWPDSDPSKGRNNLKYTLSTLRKVLREHLPESRQELELVLRSSSALQLNPDLLEDHDVVQLQRLASVEPSQLDAHWDAAAQSAVLAYAGPFLPECYLEWAATARQNLELQLLETSQRLLLRLEEQQEWEPVLKVAGHLLQLDQHAQFACLAMMKALRQTQRAAEAVKLFERQRTLWQSELGLEPEMELLREHQRALALM